MLARVDESVACCCDYCQNEIYVGEWYYEIDGFNYHEDCLVDEADYILRKHFNAACSKKSEERVCGICGEAIEVDEERYEMYGKYYHSDCFKDNAADMLQDDFDVCLEVAEGRESCRF